MPHHADAWNTQFGSSRSRAAVWLVPALLLSLALHFLLWTLAGSIEMRGSAQAPQPPPHVFQLKSLDMPTPPPLPVRAAAQLAAIRQEASAPHELKVPDEKKAFERMMGDPKQLPSAPQIDKTMLSEKPSSASATWADTVQAAEASGARSSTENLDAVRKEMLQDKPGVAGNSALDGLMASGGSPGTRSHQAGGGRNPGFSNLDDLLARTGPLTPETAPILMPTDLLFDFDSADLRSDANSSLSKLAQLIERSPNVRFRIEVHTDSFGTDVYNLALSEHRAESVKAWLVTQTHIPVATIETKGYGKTRLIKPASGSIEEQQINRRVEIVILPADGATPGTQ